MIDVLIALCRPRRKWLTEQISSIRLQDGVNTRPCIREDTFSEGACANFSELIKTSTADYVAFSDQDDVWLSDKLKKCMAKMRELERAWGRETPLLIFSDSKVVDENLNVIDSSLYRRIKVNPLRNLPRQLILQNTAYGNTMLFNAALRELVNPIPAEAVMHDHWTMLVASAFGHIGYVNESLLLYRQHGRNVFGGAKVGIRYFVWKYSQGRAALRRRLYANIRQAAAFAERFGDRSPAAFHAVVGFEKKSYLRRVWTLIRHGIFKDGVIRNLGTWAVI